MDPITPDAKETDRLLERLRGGDRQAADRLMALHRPYLRRFVELRLDPKLHPRVDPSDVVQEAQMDAARRLAAYLEQPELPFRLWLRQIAQDRLLKVRRYHIETARRTLTREEPLPDRSSILLARQLFAADPSPSARLDGSERAGQVRRALDRLPEADREVLLLRTVEGLSYQEIGYLLGIESAAARKRQGRALARLHRLLFDDGLVEALP